MFGVIDYAAVDIIIFGIWVNEVPDSVLNIAWVKLMSTSEYVTRLVLCHIVSVGKYHLKLFEFCGLLMIL